MPITLSSIPARYDSRVKIEPCDPARVPYLPTQILYLIARALPHPKSVFNLALSSRDTWEYLQPVLYQCEVTFESRLGERYGGRSSGSWQNHFRELPINPRWQNILVSNGDDEIEETTTTGPSDPNLQASDKVCQHGKATEQCDECGERIRLENQTFESPWPDNLLDTNRRLTALHWACKQGPSALPVALKAIRSALAHQPSYIDGLGLRERVYRDTKVMEKYDYDEEDTYGKNFPADLPPPLFFAVAHGNIEACKALIEAGCNVNLLQCQNRCTVLLSDHTDAPLLIFKVHKECAPEEPASTLIELSNKMTCDNRSFYWPTVFKRPGCQTAGHAAVRHGRSEILEMLLRAGLDTQLGRLPLIYFAVSEGNLAAIKILLEHDQNLLHRRAWGQALIHAVPFMRKRLGDDKASQDGRVRGMLEYLLARGLSLDTRSDRFEGSEGSEVTALQTALAKARSFALVRPRHLDILNAAEVFIRMGSSWNQGMLASQASEGILECSVVWTVGLFSGWSVARLGESHFHLCRETRRAWGRLVKAMIDSASQPRSPALMETFSNAFSYMVNYVGSSDDPTGWDNGIISHRGFWDPDRVDPWATAAVGKLLLSTGITPNHADIEKWETRCLEDREDEWVCKQVGDTTQWEFLLAGIN